MRGVRQLIQWVYLFAVQLFSGPEDAADETLMQWLGDTGQSDNGIWNDGPEALWTMAPASTGGNFRGVLQQTYIDNNDSQYGVVGNPQLAADYAGANQGTIVLKFDRDGNSSEACAVEINDASDSLQRFGIQVGGAPNTDYFLTTGNSYGYVSDSSTGIHTYFLVYDGTLTGNTNRLKVYKDAQTTPVTLTYNGTVPATLSANLDRVLWNDVYDLRHCFGNYYGAAYFSDILTEAERQAIHNDDDWYTPDNCKALWLPPMCNPSGTIANTPLIHDLSGNDNHVVVNNIGVTPTRRTDQTVKTYNPANKQGYNSVYVHTGGTEHHSSSDTMFQVGADSAWFYIEYQMTDSTPAAESCLLSKYGTGGNREYLLTVLTNGDVQWKVQTSFSDTATFSGSSFHDGQPHTVLAYIDAIANEIGVSVDGAAFTTTFTTGTVPTTTTPFRIGYANDSGTTYAFNGHIGNVAIGKNPTDTWADVYTGIRNKNFDEINSTTLLTNYGLQAAYDPNKGSHYIYSPDRERTHGTAGPAVLDTSGSPTFTFVPSLRTNGETQVTTAVDCTGKELKYRGRAGRHAIIRNNACATANGSHFFDVEEGKAGSPMFNDGTQAMDITFWVNRTGAVPSGVIVSKMQEGSSNSQWDGWSLMFDGSQLMWQMYNDFQNNRLITLATTQVPLNVWTHIRVTYDGSTNASGVAIYYDGVEQSRNTFQDTLTAIEDRSAPIRVFARYSVSVGGAIIGDNFQVSDIVITNDVGGGSESTLHIPCSEGTGELLHGVYEDGTIATAPAQTSVNVSTLWSNTQDRFSWDNYHGASRWIQYDASGTARTGYVPDQTGSGFIEFDVVYNELTDNTYCLGCRNSSNGAEFGVRINSSDKLLMFYGLSTAVSTVTITAGVKYHVKVSWNASSFGISVDNETEVTNTAGTTGLGSADLAIGGRNNGGTQDLLFNGLIRNITVDVGQTLTNDYDWDMNYVPRAVTYDRDYSGGNTRDAHKDSTTNTQLDGSQSWWFGAWIHTDTVSTSGNDDVIAATNNKTPAACGFQLTRKGAGVYLDYRNTSGTLIGSVTIGSGLDTTEPHSVVAYYDSGAGQIGASIDGGAFSTADVSSGTFGTFEDVLTLGNYANTTQNGYCFDGRIHTVMMGATPTASFTAIRDAFYNDKWPIMVDEFTNAMKQDWGLVLFSPGNEDVTNSDRLDWSGNDTTLTDVNSVPNRTTTAYYYDKIRDTGPNHLHFSKGSAGTPVQVPVWSGTDATGATANITGGDKLISDAAAQNTIDFGGVSNYYTQNYPTAYKVGSASTTSDQNYGNGARSIQNYRIIPEGMDRVTRFDDSGGQISESEQDTLQTNYTLT